MATPTVATVPVVSAWASKINWTAGLGFLTSIVVASTGLIPAPYNVAAPIIIQGAQSGLTWLFRTYFNGSVSPSSLPSS